MSAPDVAVVIVNYNAGPDLRCALESIASELAGCQWEAFVIDNGSTDGSHAIVEEFAPHVRLVRNAANVGFASGVNQGARVAAAPLLLLMNPDCRLGAGAFGVMRATLISHESCAVVGPRILNSDGSLQGSARGDPDMLTGLFGRSSRLRRLVPWLPVSRRNVIAEQTAAHEDGVVVDWVSGACMLIRRSAFDAVGGLDERYFLYWEDADFCRRIRNARFEVRYSPAATAVHRAGQSSRTARASSIRAFHESAFLYYSTHVASGTWHPKRLAARMLLAARCWWELKNLLY